MADEISGSYDFFILLMVALRSLKDELHEQLAQVGFTDVRPLHGFVFQLLASNNGASVNEVADHLGMTKQAASQMLEYLEEHGYVIRRPDPKDGRGKQVVLTARAWACIRETERILSNQEARLVQLLGRERLAQMGADLRSLILEANGGTMPRQLRPPVW